MNIQLMSTVLSSTVLQGNQEVESILEDYRSIPVSLSSGRLRLAALKRYPALREMAIDNPVDDQALITSHGILKRSNYTQEVWQSIEVFLKKLQQLFPSNKYVLSHRVLDSKQVEVKLKKNGLRAHFDTVGFKLVSCVPFGLLQAIELFEQSDALILFRFNTFPFSKKEYRLRIGPNSSSSYRAMHYYVSLGSVIAEVQIRSPGIDVWSQIHHSTLYKPTGPISKANRNGILALGEIANVVDFTKLF
jgi:flagellar biosynthesis/type III secretory pathway chaperone